MNTPEARIFRQILISVIVFAGACAFAQFGNYERAFMRHSGMRFESYWMLLPLCAPLILALLYLSLRINNWMEFGVTSFAVGLTGTAFVFAMKLLARPGFRKGDPMAMDDLIPFWAIGTLLVAIFMGTLWGVRVALKILWNLPKAGKKLATKVRKATRIRKEPAEPALHE